MFGEICVPSGLEAYLIHSDISFPISPILMWSGVFLGGSVGNLKEVCVFEVKWPKANCLKSYLGTGLIPISPITQIVMGPIRRGNKNIIGEISVLTNVMAKKPLYH